MKITPLHATEHLEATLIRLAARLDYADYRNTASTIALLLEMDRLLDRVQHFENTHGERSGPSGAGLDAALRESLAQKLSNLIPVYNRAASCDESKTTWESICKTFKQYCQLQTVPRAVQSFRLGHTVSKTIQAAI